MKDHAARSGAELLKVALISRPEDTVQIGDGEEVEVLPASVLLLQAVHHAHEHRTQVTTLLGQQGLEPPGLSGWRYFDVEMKA